MMPLRYSSALIVLHWAMAIAVAGMVATALLADALMPTSPWRSWLMATHKATGFILLLAVIGRVLLRVFSRIPAWPTQLPPQARRWAQWGQGALYLFLFLTPLSGWLMVSAYQRSIDVFGWLTVPPISGLSHDLWLREWLQESHEVLAYSMLVLVAGHIGMAVWHARRHGVNLLSRLWWGRAGRNQQS